VIVVVDGVPSEHDREGARYLRGLYERALAGSGEAQATLGSLFCDPGLGWLPEDLGRARFWTERAVASGNVPALSGLADLCLRARDVDRAVALYERAIRRGSRWAMYRLARYYLDRRDRAKGLPLLRRAAAAGEEGAVCELAQRYIRQKAYAKAAKLLASQLRRRDSDEAAYHLAFLYLDGKGVRRSDKIAFRLARRATRHSMGARPPPARLLLHERHRHATRRRSRDLELRAILVDRPTPGERPEPGPLLRIDRGSPQRAPLVCAQ